MASPSFDRKHRDLLDNHDCQVEIDNNAKPLWKAGATNCSALKGHSKKGKPICDKVLQVLSLLVPRMYMYIPLFRSLVTAFVAWTSIPACTKTGASNTAINTKPEAHPYFSGPHNGPCPSTHFQGLDPPPSPQTRGDSKDLGNSLEAWLVSQCKCCHAFANHSALSCWPITLFTHLPCDISKENKEK